MTRITQLPVASTLTDNSTFVIVDVEQSVTKRITWQTLRDGGLRGIQGPVGNTGTQGLIGPTGTVATLRVGTVEMTTSSQTASVVVSSSTSVGEYTVDFVFPYGPKGDTGVVSWSSMTNSIIPGEDYVYSIGSFSKRWKDLYLSGDTMVLGGTTFSNPTVPFIATLTDATYFEATSTISLLSVGSITTGSTFEAPAASLQTGETLYVTKIEGNTVHFEPSVIFTSNFTPETEIQFRNSTELLINGVPAKYTLTSATSVALGGVMIGSGVNVDGTGKISVTPYTLLTATNVRLGGIKIGAGIGVSADGTISVTTGAFALQTASPVILGGVKIGNGIDVSSSGTVSVNPSYRSADLLTGTTLSSTVTATSIRSVGVLDNLEVYGTTKLRQTAEYWNSAMGISGQVDHDCSYTTVFKIITPASNWTANFTNVSTSSFEVISVAMIIQQGSTPHIPLTVKINGVTQTVNWHSGVTPTGNANKYDLVDFSFICQGTSAYIVLGSLASFG